VLLQSFFLSSLKMIPIYQNDVLLASIFGGILAGTCPAEKDGKQP